MMTMKSVGLVRIGGGLEHTLQSNKLFFLWLLVQQKKGALLSCTYSSNQLRILSKLLFTHVPLNFAFCPEFINEPKQE